MLLHKAKQKFICPITDKLIGIGEDYYCENEDWLKRLRAGGVIEEAETQEAETQEAETQGAETQGAELAKEEKLSGRRGNKKDGAEGA